MASQPKEVLLVDGDVIAFISAAAAQKDVLYPHLDQVMRWASISEGEAILDRMMIQLADDFPNHAEIKVFLTDVSEEHPNWRTEVFPGYKGNRKAQQRPQLLTYLRSYLKERYGAVSEPGLEADDLMGMAATEPRHPNHVTVMCTIDKDLRTVPGRFYRLGKRVYGGKPHVDTITVSDAKRFHYAQALAGDRVDNFFGCPGIGMTRALRIIDAPVILHPEDSAVTVGPRKGQRTTKWRSRPTKDVWACIVSHYHKAGLDEDDALVSARLARILHHGEYDFDTKQVKLWEPRR